PAAGSTYSGMRSALPTSRTVPPRWTVVVLRRTKTAADALAAAVSAPTTTRTNASFLISGDGDDPFLAAELLAELGVQRPLELAAPLELLDDVCAADQLAADEDLRDRRPARERREVLADLGVGQDVDGRHRGSRAAERRERALRVAAHDVLRRPLHEERERRAADHLIDLVSLLAHPLPLVVIRSSWIVPSASGAASAS